MRIQVTQKDIDLGRPECIGCPIARALFRETGRGFAVFDGVAVDTASGVYADLPQDALAFVDRYDAGLRVEPLTFELEYDLP